jgi:hypothetical protein
VPFYHVIKGNIAIFPLKLGMDVFFIGGGIEKRLFAAN